MFKSDKRLYVNRDETEIVEEGSPEAASLLVGAGGEIPDEVAKKYGLTNAPEAQENSPADQAVNDAKEAKQAANKAAPKTETK